jgi:hypothetical protein
MSAKIPKVSGNADRISLLVGDYIRGVIFAL